MSVIIRLQNLPWSANALDIRQFFNGLAIPEGGVHIVGGEQGDAFIAFRYSQIKMRAKILF
jgi:RNA-binding protein 12